MSVISVCAVLYAPGLSGNLFYLTNDSLVPLSPSPLTLTLSISLTFLPSLLSLSLWAHCPSARLSRSFSLLHLARLLSWKSLIKFHGSGRFLNDLHSPADKSLHSACRSLPPCAILSMVPDWHMACVSQLSGGKLGTFSSENGPFFFNQHFHLFNFWWILTFPPFQLSKCWSLPTEASGLW